MWILLATACGLGPHELTTPEYDGVVLQADKKLLDLFDRADEPKHDGIWSLSDADVEQFESGIEAYLHDSADPREQALEARLPTYKRQWVGVMAGERKDLFANFLCREETDWKQGLFMIRSGGDCYFQVLFDVEAKRYFGLTINND